MGGNTSEDFSVVVLASDFAVDARPFLFHDAEQQQEEENWHDCSQYLSPDEDFSDLEQLQFITLQGSDKGGARILRIVGKHYPGKSLTSLDIFVDYSSGYNNYDYEFCIVSLIQCL